MMAHFITCSIKFYKEICKTYIIRKLPIQILEYWKDEFNVMQLIQLYYSTAETNVANTVTVTQRERDMGDRGGLRLTTKPTLLSINETGGEGRFESQQRPLLYTYTNEMLRVYVWTCGPPRHDLTYEDRISYILGRNTHTHTHTHTHAHTRTHTSSTKVKEGAGYSQEYIMPARAHNRTHTHTYVSATHRLIVPPPPSPHLLPGSPVMSLTMCRDKKAVGPADNLFQNVRNWAN